MSHRKKADYLVVRVELLSGWTNTFDPPPGRDFLIHADDTFGDFADAINTAFARWDISHLHEFRFPDKTAIGVPDTDWAIEQEIEDENAVTVAKAQVQASEAAVEMARLDLEYTSIVSPIDGRTGRRLVDVGHVVSPTDGAPVVAEACPAAPTPAAPDRATTVSCWSSTTCGI